MKKNITINLAGQLFAIDEDAYELLLNYTDALRRYYRRQTEGEEVVDDIEARIAELFNELKSRGFNAITVEHVQDIIKRIGRVEDITGAATEGAGSADGQGFTTADAAAGAAKAAGNAARSAADSLRSGWNKVRSGKRFYRDTENRMLAGVLAGCSKYFGGDVVIWRIVFLFLAFVPLPLVSNLLGGLTGTLVLLYIILAVVAPSADTPEEVLKMRGEEVNPQNLGEEVSRQNFAASANEPRVQRRNAMRVCIGILFTLFSIWTWLAVIGVLIAIVASAVAGPAILTHISHASGIHFPASTTTDGIVFLLSVIEIFLVITAYCTLRIGLSLLDHMKPMGLKERILWLVLWLVSLVAVTMTCAKMGKDIAVILDDIERIEAEEDNIDALRNEVAAETADTATIAPVETAEAPAATATADSAATRHHRHHHKH